MPQRIQRKRIKGWKMPENAVYVGRPTKWGNVFKVDEHMFGFDVVYKDIDGLQKLANGSWLTREMATKNAVELFEWDLLKSPSKDELLTELRGKDLACWCPLDQPCHADILLKLANGE